MYCGKCGALISDKEGFCMQCETPVGVSGGATAPYQVPIQNPTPAPQSQTPIGHQGVKVAKGGAEKTFAIVVIILAALKIVLGPLVGIVNNYFYSTLGLNPEAVSIITFVMQIWAPLGFTLLGVIALFSSRKLTITEKATAKWLSSVALADIVAGAAFILSVIFNAILIGVQYTVMHNESAFELLSILSAARLILEVICIAAAIVFFILSFGKAKAAGKSTGALALPVIMLSVYLTFSLVLVFIQPILVSFMPSTGAHIADIRMIMGLLSFVSALILAAFFIARALFWFGAVKRYGNATTAVPGSVAQPYTVSANER